MASLGLWRLTRTDAAIRVYEALKAAGVTGTQMHEYVADLGAGGFEERRLPAGVDLAVRDGASVDAAARSDFTDPVPEDTVLLARESGETVGYLFVSDRTVHVDALEADLEFEGVYIWRVFVDPAERERGIATGLVAAACRRASEAGHGTAHALVATDNRPSQWTFEACGFVPARERTYVRVFGWRHRSVSPLAAGGDTGAGASGTGDGTAD
jgi:GNAT superfamily N-acetyltransferase